MRTIVIGDLHGDYRGLLAILRATGAIDADNQRLPDTRVIQLGDLIHGGAARHAWPPPPREGVDDEECAIIGLRYCDTVLIGNHELPLVWPDAGFPTWNGQRPLSPSLRVRLHEAYLRGQLVPATSVGDWLLTHAGLYPRLRLAKRSAADLTTRMGAEFKDRIATGGRNSLFDWVGERRGGRNSYGGIFWCDWQELISAPSPIPQIVGHTPQGDAPHRYGNLWCVDVGAALSGRVAALVSDDDGATWTPIVADATQPAATDLGPHCDRCDRPGAICVGMFMDEPVMLCGECQEEGAG